MLLFLTAGLGLVELLPALRERSVPARLGWSYLLGVAAVAGFTYLLGIAFDVRIRRGVVLAPILALIVLGCLARGLRRAKSGTPLRRPPRAGRLFARAAFGVAGVISVGLFAAALTQPNLGWDGEMTWSAAARWVRSDGSVTPRALTNPHTFVSHPRYPILMPLAQVVVQEAFDAGDDRRVIKPLYAAFFPALLLVLFDLARRHAGTLAAALTAVAFACVPVLAFREFGGADGSYSDVPLGAFLGGGVLLLLGRAPRSESVAGALLLGASVLTKNEGLPFALAALAGVSLVAVLARPIDRRRRITSLVFAAASVLTAGLFLVEWQARIPQRWDEDYLRRFGEVSLVAEAKARIPLMPAAIAREMTNGENLAGFGVASALIVIFGVCGLRRRIVPPIILFVYLCSVAYVLALLLTTWGGVEQIHPTWDRFLIQLSIPLGVLLALALRDAWRARVFARRTQLPRETTAPRGVRQTRGKRFSTYASLLFGALTALPVVTVLLCSLGLRQSKETWREDPSLTGSVDEPRELSTVRGALSVGGWARIPGQDLRVVIFIDGRERSFASSARIERRDVQRVVPSLGNCSSAGYKFTYTFSLGDAGAHEIQVVFRSTDGRERHYPLRRFLWNP